MSAFTTAFGVVFCGESMDIRIRAVILSTEGIKKDKEISSSFGISERTLRRWKKSYKIAGINGLNPNSTKPVNSSNQMPKALMVCLSWLKPNHSLAKDLQGIMLILCGKETLSSSESTTWARYMLQVLLMTAQGTESNQKCI